MVMGRESTLLLHHSKSSSPSGIPQAPAPARKPFLSPPPTNTHAGSSTHASLPVAHNPAPRRQAHPLLGAPTPAYHRGGTPHHTRPNPRARCGAGMAVYCLHSARPHLSCIRVAPGYRRPTNCNVRQSIP
ncbi:hypothetical protein BD779DRAFT_1017063 [Infundibulicybe gibba]|nr:hypothetical protein BD779DRAFT_1017063 [Infundibulicybe gibba]